jgi:hypothetical protein
MLDKIPIARYTRFVTAGRGGGHSGGVQSQTNPGIRGLNIAAGLPRHNEREPLCNCNIETAV